MPNIKRAKKKDKQDKRKRVINDLARRKLKDTVKSVTKAAKNVKEDLSNAFSVIDKAVKKGLIHKNKGARLKSKVTKTSNKK